eukprot:1162043-Pelagomonas_calceolata.AAC.6
MDTGERSKAASGSFGDQPTHVHYIGLSATPSELALRLFGVSALGCLYFRRVHNLRLYFRRVHDLLHLLGPVTKGNEWDRRLLQHVHS